MARSWSRRSAALVGGAAACAVVAALAWPLPEAWFAPGQSRRVLDRRGALLAERALPDRGRQEWVELGELSPWVVPALLASEDRRFGRHPGVDPIAVARATWVNVRAGRVVEGGSTLHQQTARVLAGRPPGLGGKVVEAWRAVRLWLHTSDEEVLTWYLNRAYFGAGCHGVAAAARRTFDEPPSALSLSEAATLVGLLPAPSRLHPDVDPGAARAARDRVLDDMVRGGFVDAEAAELARAEPLQPRRPRVDTPAAQFVEFALDQAPGDDVVTTTLDARLQREVAALAAARVASLADHGVTQAAVLVVHLPDREVHAWVGSADPTAADGLVDGVLAHRSPGSALKPLLYAAAFDEGLRPSDVLHDVPGRWATTHGSWLPENYDHRSLGPVSARRALGSSANVPAVRVLERVGVAAFQARLVAAGFRAERTATSLGLGLSLGDLDVSLLELVRASTALAGDGVVRPLVTVRGAAEEPGVRVVTARSAALVTDVLADPSARTSGFGRHGPLERGYPAAAKTGTSTGFRDNWTVGWTPEWLVGVWVGRFDGAGMREVSGVAGAAPLWGDVLDRVVGDAERPFPPPPGMERRPVCALSGGAPGPGCDAAPDWFPVGAAPVEPCAWHVEGCAGVAWPPELAAWAHERGLPSCVPPGAAAATARVEWPDDGAVVWVDPRLPAESQRLPLRASAPAGVAFSWRVDGVAVGEGRPGEVLPWLATGAGTHVVEVVVDGAVADRRTVVVRGGR